MNIENDYVYDEIRILWQLCMIFRYGYAEIKCVSVIWYLLNVSTL